MATATKMKAEPKPAAQPITFDEIAHKRMSDRLRQYREFVSRQATGETLNADEMGAVADVLDLIGLPAFAFSRDIEAMQRFRHSQDKHRAAVEAVPEHHANAMRLAAEVEAMKAKLDHLREEHRRALAGTNKPTAYGQTLAALAHEHPHLLADIDTAARLRVEELDRRKRSLVGGAV